MEIPSDTPPEDESDGPHSPHSARISDSDYLVVEIESLRESYQALQSKCLVFEADLLLVQRQKDEALKHKEDLARVIDELSVERDFLRDKILQVELGFEEKEAGLLKNIDEGLAKREEFENEIGVWKRRVEELENKNGNEVVKWKEDLCRVIDEFSSERSFLRDKIRELEIGFEEKEAGLLKKISEELAKRKEFENEVGVWKGRVEELEGEKAEADKQKEDISRVMDELFAEKDGLRDKIRELEMGLVEKEAGFLKRTDEESAKRKEVENEIDFWKRRNEELEGENGKKTGILLENLESLSSIKKCLVRIIENVDEGQQIESVEEESIELEVEDKLKVISEEAMAVTRLGNEAESKVSEYKEMKKKEKRELEGSVVSLTEENRDINSLLRIALVEKEAVEKTLHRLKGGGEQKRVALLQIAERGLQRVGFGFMMGSGGSIEQSSETSEINMGNRSDSSECEEEIVSVASTVERIMKNLRLEITQLRRSLEESRSDTERLQSLAEKHAQTISENALYIKELEDRESMLVQNVEELLIEIKETETEVTRWREACELEVEAGKNEIDERDKVVSIMKQELEKTKAALETSNGKLKLKEELVSAAMAAQAAAEKSLQLADSRSTGLRERIEELTHQLEETESRERNNRHKVRHICWPWRALKVNAANSTNSRVQSVRRMLPEMQALLHNSV